MEHNDYILQKFAFEYQTILECTWYRAKGYINKQLRSVLKNLPVETERKKKTFKFKLWVLNENFDNETTRFPAYKIIIDSYFQRCINHRSIAHKRLHIPVAQA